MLRAFDFSAAGLREGFRYRIPVDPRSMDPAIRADCDYLHLAVPSDDLISCFHQTGRGLE
ncbi:MAG: hypothetical protein GY703_12525 [Gammaproteobacteria bacterium]|nr:hypothetical protein [Gammaproteobacteria bacterium]